MRELRNIRLRSGLSQADLSARTGVAEFTISEIETGKRTPRPSTLRKLAQGLGVEVADLYGETAHPLGEAPEEQRELPLTAGLSVDLRWRVYANFEDATRAVLAEVEGIAERRRIVDQMHLSLEREFEHLSRAS